MEQNQPYDSTKDTQEHIYKVQEYLIEATQDLLQRARVHDASKLLPPEKEHFDRETPLLANIKYGTKEYSDSTKRLKEALDHHYANNDHHPQFHKELGIDGMNLFSLLEMFFDWKASGERNAEGNIYDSIRINKERKKVNMSEQLAKIFVNTAKYMGFEEPEEVGDQVPSQETQGQ